MSRLPIVLAVVLACVACNPTKLRPGYCHTTADCGGNGRTCNPQTRKCEPTDASTDGDGGQDAFACNRCGATGTDGGHSVCDVDASRCVECLSNGDCTGAKRTCKLSTLTCEFSCSQCAGGGADGGASVCDLDAGRCVGCLTDDDCGGDGGTNKVCDPSTLTCVGCLPSNNPCTGTTPVCADKVCRPCAVDSECATGVCMVDGHCAGSGEILFVEFSASGCPGADGSSADPYCTPNEAVAKLENGKNVIVIRGPTADRLTLNTTDLAPVVVGKPGSGNVAASIPATAATAIQVLSDTVLIRDLVVNGGTAATSKGIVVSGSSTSATLVNMRVNLTTGLGVQADAGAQLVMDRCTVTSNSAGGLMINGAGYDVQNSIFASNGFSQLQFSSISNPGLPKFRFNTVVAMTGVAATCDVSNMRTISDSIVVGGHNCMLVNSLTAAPFRSTSDFHITAHSACPDPPAAPLPPRDIDGEPRTSTLDCGADQLVP